MQQVDLVGVIVDLLDLEDALDRVTERASRPVQIGGIDQPPLSVVSANLDHIAQFGRLGRWYDTLDYALGLPTPSTETATHHGDGSADWLVLLDGAPLVAEAIRLTGKSWPRLAGSDIIGPLLDRAEKEGLSVGFLGGSYVVQRILSRTVTRNRPHLKVSGFWAPDRKELVDHEASLRLAESIKASHTQILVVGLGKPRQELWMAKYGPATGANVLLAFGAVVDFLAGSVQRAPGWASDNGLEWAWRLALEPRRLARRYLIDDPPSLIRLRRESRLVSAVTGVGFDHVWDQAPPTSGFPAAETPDHGNSFVPAGQRADITVLAVTYNNADTVEDLISSLRSQTRGVKLRVVVADNGSTDSTIEMLALHPDVMTVRTGGNLGYAGGLNAVMRHADNCEAVLVLNPDLRVEPDAISLLLDRMRRSGAGIVVPRLLESDGSTYVSLRREPTIATAIGDALFGARFTGRPGWASELDYDAESYQHPHRIDWATGAALLVRSSLAKRLGAWDEQFFLYSEEVDYFRRAREGGASIWYEPASEMTHHMGGSGSSTSLNALMSINRIRYIRKYHGKSYASGFRSAVLLAELLRAYKPSRRGILKTILDEDSWSDLPRPSAGPQAPDSLETFPTGTIIIPAHNEEAVIARTLRHLSELAASGAAEVIVACNGCTDRTAKIAASFPGVKVLEVSEASKVAALNAADEAATRWPRIYLDADIEMTPTAVHIVLDRLTHSDVLAARPAFEYDYSKAAPPVRAFYRARRRIPSTNQALWGSGVYGLTEAGHARFGKFPSLTADDLFVDQQFEPWEKLVLSTPPVRVITPRTVASLIVVLQRNYRGQAEFVEKSSKLSNAVPVPTAFVSNGGNGSRRTARELLGSIRGPGSALDAAVYASFVIRARLNQKRLAGQSDTQKWERDDSRRI